MSATVPSVRLHVEDSGGKGRPVILIHGWPLSAASWRHQIAPLRDAGYRVIAYDRRGFGRSEKPANGYDYDTLASDLAALLDERDVHDASLVGFSMGGGEVARYLARYGNKRIHSVVFAAAVPPYLLKTADNPEGPMSHEMIQQFKAGIEKDRNAFFANFAKGFYTAKGTVKVDEATLQETVAMAQPSCQQAVLGCMQAFAETDFRQDLNKVTVPTLVIHGDSDGTVPFEGSGKRTHQAISKSQLVVLADAPHGCNVSHANAFNSALCTFLAG